MNYQREKVTDSLIEEMRPLLFAHWKEIAHYQDIPLDPNFDLYKRREEDGALRVFTARDEGKLVGYSIFVISRNAHYWGSIQASQDILFIDPSRRGGLHGYKLIAFSEAELKKEGVQVVYHHVKTKHNFGPMLERQGYELIDLIYGKRLDKETA